MVKMKVRVVNKTKEGVTFKVLGLPKRYQAMGKSEATWDEFNETFEPVEGEKFIYVMKKEHAERIEAKNKLFSEMMPWMMSTRVKQAAIDNGTGSDHSGFFAGAGMIGHFLQRYQDEFGGAPIDFIIEYRQFEQAMTETMMMDGVGVGSVHTKNYDYHEDKWDEEDRKKVRKALDPENKNGAMTIGDMLKGKGVELERKD